MALRRVTRSINPDRQIINDFIWKPIAELEVDHVFAFGAPWSRFADDRLRLPEQQTQIELTVPSRRVRLFKLPSGQRLVVCWQPGYNGPPGAPDVEALRAGLKQAGQPRPDSWFSSEAARRPSFELLLDQAIAR